MRQPRRLILACLAIASLVLSACGGDDGTTPQTGGTSPGPGGTAPVDVTVKEWSLLAQTGDLDRSAGTITFNVTNEGPKHKHEFVVIKTDLAGSALPTKPDGSVDESGAGIEVIGEIEEFDVGQTKSMSFTLTAGKYLFICNVVEEEAMADMGGIKAHYKLGMFLLDTFDVS